jgi:hypothetical protein
MIKPATLCHSQPFQTRVFIVIPTDILFAAPYFCQDPLLISRMNISSIALVHSIKEKYPPQNSAASGKLNTLSTETLHLFQLNVILKLHGGNIHLLIDGDLN